MRFMMLLITSPKGDDWRPSAGAIAAMSAFNREMDQAGVRLTAEGLRPMSQGARVSFGAGVPTITDGPFTEAKEVVGGYWIIQAKSKAEAVEWARRCPAGHGDAIEVRQFWEMSDFPEGLEKAGSN